MVSCLSNQYGLFINLTLWSLCIYFKYRLDILQWHLSKLVPRPSVVPEYLIFTGHSWRAPGYPSIAQTQDFQSSFLLLPCVILVGPSTLHVTSSLQFCICYCRDCLGSLCSSSSHVLAECIVLLKTESIAKIKSVLLGILIVKLIRGFWMKSKPQMLCGSFPFVKCSAFLSIYCTGAVQYGSASGLQPNFENLFWNRESYFWHH